VKDHEVVKSSRRHSGVVSPKFGRAKFFVVSDQQYLFGTPSIKSQNDNIC